jgi:hypothetical protein
VDSLLDSSEHMQPNPSQSLAQAPTDSKSSTFTTLGWITAGATLAAGAGVFIAWRVREGAVGDFNEEDRLDGGCTSEHSLVQPPDCLEHLAAADSAESVMWVLGFTSMSLAALATTFFVLGAEDGHSEKQARRSCGPGPGELGIACRMTF